MRFPTVRLHRNVVRLVILTSLTLGWLATPGLGDVTLQQSSLRFVPADAAFYFSLMNNRRQYDAVANSRAIARLLEMPFMQTARAGAEQQLEAVPAEAAEAKKFFETEQGRQVKELLIEMVSDEVFIYGGHNYQDLFELQQALADLVWKSAIEEIRQQSQNQLEDATEEVETEEADLFGDENENAADETDEEDTGDEPFGEDDLGESAEDEPETDDEDARLLLRFLTANMDKLQVPDTVVGFKLRDVNRAASQLERLELLITMGLSEEPKLQEALQHKKIGGTDFLLIVLDESTIPWDEMNVEQSIKPYEEEPGEFDELIQKLKRVTVTVALGIYDQHLLLFVGSSADHLDTLGHVPLLARGKELQPLRPYADRHVALISYVSDELVQTIGSGKKMVDNWIAMFDALAEDGDVPADLKPRVRADLKEFGADIKSFIPDPGPSLRFSFLTDRGYEVFCYKWAENLRLDGSQPLTILEHVGGDPIWFFARRKKFSLEGYRVLTKWLGKMQGYFEKVGLDKLDDAQRKQYAQAKDLFTPIVEQLDAATGEMLLPAFKDGQFAFVLDSKLTSDQLHMAMPPSSQPLPIPEPALVFGVGDAELLKKACAEYVAIVERAAAKIKETIPEAHQIPDNFKVPPPATRTFPKEGTFYYYQGAAAVGVEEQVVPAAGLSDEFLSLAVSAKHARRLLNSSTLVADGPLKNVDRPLAAAVHFSWERLVDTLKPWIDYSIEQVGANAGADISDDSVPNDVPSDEADDDGAEQLKATLAQVHAGLEILKCFRGYSSATYVEDDAVVTHSEWHFQDLAP